MTTGTNIKWINQLDYSQDNNSGYGCRCAFNRRQTKDTVAESFLAHQPGTNVAPRDRVLWQADDVSLLAWRFDADQGNLLA